MAITPTGGWTQIEEVSEDNATAPSLNVVQKRAPTAGVYTPGWDTTMGWLGLALAIKSSTVVGGETVELWID